MIKNLRYRSTLLLFLICFSVQIMHGQDIHFSHIKATPTFINPAMTGLFNGHIRYAANYRGQWNAFTNGYKTIAASADMRVKDLKSSIFGAGVSVFSDKAGDLNFSTNSLSLNASFIQLLGKKTWASFGIQNALTQNRFNFLDAKTLQQETSDFSQSVFYWHLSTGLALMHELKNGNLLYLGTSVFHINQPEVSFLGTGAITDPSAAELLDIKLSIHGGADINLFRSLELRAAFLFTDQGPHREISVGSFLKYSRDFQFSNSDKTAKLYLGAWLRWYSEVDVSGADALIATARLDINNTSIALSYDVNVSTLTRISSGQGGFELSIVKIINKKRKRVGNHKLKCPVDYF